MLNWRIIEKIFIFLDLFFQQAQNFLFMHCAHSSVFKSWLIYHVIFSSWELMPLVLTLAQLGSYSGKFGLHQTCCISAKIVNAENAQRNLILQHLASRIQLRLDTIEFSCIGVQIWLKMINIDGVRRLSRASDFRKTDRTNVYRWKPKLLFLQYFNLAAAHWKKYIFCTHSYLSKPSTTHSMLTYRSS